jgi:hypothetical protein
MYVLKFVLNYAKTSGKHSHVKYDLTVCVSVYIYIRVYTSIMWQIAPLLDNDREINNETTAIARQPLRKYATVQQPFLGNSPRATMRILLEALVSMDALPRYTIRPTDLK